MKGQRKNKVADVDAWMPLWIGDYLRDTMNLTMGHHGAYLLLIMHSWTQGPFPDDIEEIAAIVRAPANEAAIAWQRVQRYFRLVDGLWHHDRVIAERAAATENAERVSKARSEAGKKGAEARKQQPPNNAEANAAANAPAIAKHSPSPSTSTSPIQEQEIVPASADSYPQAGTKPDKPPKPPKPRKRQLPEDFSISDRVREWYAKEGFKEPIQAHFDSFVLKAKAAGYSYIDWDAALMNAIRSDWARLRVNGFNHGLNGIAVGPAAEFPHWRRDESQAIALGRKIGLQPRPGEEMHAYRMRIDARLAEAVHA